MEEGGAVGAEQAKPAQEPGKQGQAGATLYVGNLAPEASEDQLGAIFAMLQPTQLKIMRDKVSGMSAGFGFVTFAERSIAEQALESLNGQVAWGRPLKLQWAQHRSGSGGAPGEGGQQQSFDVFVGDLARDVDETKLREAFGHLGTVTRVVVMWDYPTGRNKGYGFVSFATQQEAEQAIQQMHGAMVGSRPVRCGWGQRRAQTPQHHGGQHGHGPFGGQQRGGRGGGGGGHQQQWGGGPRGGGAGGGFPQHAGSAVGGAGAGGGAMGGYPQLPAALMMGMGGMDPQQLAQLGFTPASAGGASARGGEGGPPTPSAAGAAAGGGSQTANGVMERGGNWGGRKGGRGGGQAGKAQPPPPEHHDMPHMPSSSVSLPALAEGRVGAGSGGGSGGGGEGGAAGGASCCVRVDNVDKTVQKAELFGAFAKFGTLEDCNIVRKGNPYHAIIRFGTPQQAADAAAAMNGFSLDGRRLRCAVEGASGGADAGAMPRPKSTSDLPMPPRALDRSQAVEALAAKMRAVLQDRGDIPGQSPTAAGGRSAGGAAAQAAASAGEPGSGTGSVVGSLEAGGGAGGFGGGGYRGPHGSGAGGFGGIGGRPQPQQAQQQHGPHQWMPPGQQQVPGGEPITAMGGGPAGRHGGSGGAQPGKQPGGPQPQPWGPPPQQQMQMLMAQQQAAQQAAAAAAAQMIASGGGGSGGAGGAAAAGGRPPAMQPGGGMGPMTYGAGGVVLPPQLAMLNMMAQGIPGPSPGGYHSLPMMYAGGQPAMMAASPPVMQPGFAALQQQALIQQLLIHQQAQQAAQAAAAQAAAAAAQAAQEQDSGAVRAGTPASLEGSQQEGGGPGSAAPSTSGTPPPNASSSTPPPVAAALQAGPGAEAAAAAPGADS